MPPLSTPAKQAHASSFHRCAAAQGGEQYWLYIITQAATKSPHLSRIQNPCQHFTLGEDIFATGFIIPEKKWRLRF